MIGVQVKDIPADSDDIGQSALVGLLLATGTEEMSPPFKKGDRVSVNSVLIFNWKGGDCIHSATLEGLAVEEVRYVNKVFLHGDSLLVLGWVIRFKEYPMFFPAFYFSKKV